MVVCSGAGDHGVRAARCQWNSASGWRSAVYRYARWIERGQPGDRHARDQITAGGAGQPDPHAHAFVHVLSLRQGWAFCLDLPMPFGIGQANAHALTVSPDGRNLYIADRSSGIVAVADTEKLNVTQIVDVGKDLAADHGIAGAQVGPRKTLYLTGGVEVVALNATTLFPERRWRIGGPSSGLVISPDGRRLYVGAGDRVDIFDTATGSRLGRLAAPGLEIVLYVGRGNLTP
jgi:YVTN family beta-propeller protein